MNKSKFYRLFLFGSALIFIFSFTFFLNVFINSKYHHAFAASGGTGNTNLDTSGGDLDVIGTDSSAQSLTGYAWSSNIGWIYFPNTNYGVKLNSSNFFTGYAWSSNIGWLKFGGLSNFPISMNGENGNARLESGHLKGWARFCGGMINGSDPQDIPNDSCSGSSRSDGWSGWLILDGVNVFADSASSIENGDLSGSVNQDINGGRNQGSSSSQPSHQILSGYAWGSDVVGWLDMSGLIIQSGQTVTPPPTFDSVSASADGTCKVTVRWQPSSTPPSGTTFGIRYSVNSCGVGNLGICFLGTVTEDVRSFTYDEQPNTTHSYIVRSMYNGDYQDSNISNPVSTGDCTVLPPGTTPAIGKFYTAPPAVRDGGVCALNWSDIQNSDTCDISGPNGAGGTWNYSVPPASFTNGTIPTPAIHSTSRYTLTCRNETSGTTASRTATCSLIPKFIEF